MAVVIDGRKVSAALRESIKERVGAMKRRGLAPGLAVVLVGEDPASQVYVRNKEKACADAGIYSRVIRMDADTSQEQLLKTVRELNADEKIHGILVQLPLPKGLNAETVINSIDPRKDVDAFHPSNVGRIMIGDYDFAPCTPAGIMELLKAYDIDPQGKECVVIGRSNIVGKPMAMLLLHANGTVTVCHSRTQNLKETARRADILVAAIGKAGFVTADMIKPGAVVIDVGMNRGADGKLTGDVDFAAAQEVAGYITPVPGGVGVMTITMLLENTLRAAEGFAPA